MMQADRERAAVNLERKSYSTAFRVQRTVTPGCRHGNLTFAMGPVGRSMSVCTCRKKTLYIVYLSCSLPFPLQQIKDKCTQPCGWHVEATHAWW